MSIQSEIDRINQAKTDLATAIESKGVTVPPNTTINVYPSLVQQIEQGAGLPTGGTPGQMLYQGESGPEWGDKPVMYVSVTTDSSSPTGLTADKTSEEIYQAFQNGYVVLAVVPEQLNMVIPLYAISDDEGNYTALFRKFDDQSTMNIEIQIADGEKYVTTYTSQIKANNITFTPGTTDLSADNVQDAIEEVNEKIPSAPQSVTVTLPASGWSSNAQTVTVSGVLADETAQLIQPMPAIASQAAYYAAGILCTNQAANSLTFTCQTVPTEDLTVYVVIQEVTA